jgi:hypothetical protein
MAVSVPVARSSVGLMGVCWHRQRILIPPSPGKAVAWNIFEWLFGKSFRDRRDELAVTYARWRRITYIFDMQMNCDAQYIFKVRLYCQIDVSQTGM